MKKSIIFLMSFAILFTSCRFMGGKRVNGNGNLRTEERSIGSFSGVASHGSFDVYVSNGGPAVKVEAEDNLLQHIETYVEGSTLHIETKDGIWLRPKRPIKIFISAPSFTKINSYGSGNIVGESKIVNNSRLELGINGSADIKMEVEAPEIETEINGSGNIDLRGTARSFKSVVHGSGNVHALDLKTEDADVKIFGSGNAEIFASNKLDVQTAGSGDVRYKGTAQISTNTAGSGTVKKVD